MPIRLTPHIIAVSLMCAMSSAFSQSDPAATFKQHCASCHAASPPLPNVPNLAALRELTAEAVLNSLVNGKMQAQGAVLNEVERREVSEYASGRVFGAAGIAKANQCKDSPAFDPATGPSWNGWGNGPTNVRYQPEQQGGITAANLSRLKLKWAFGYANVAAARAQPAVVGGRLFATSENSEVHALDAKTGCSYWTFKAQAGIRAALSVGPYKKDGASGYAVYFADSRANAYAVDVSTGQQLWTRKVDEHPAAAVTGAPTLYEGRLFVPVQGLREEGQGGTPNYACCSFRGNLTALDTNTGEILWKTYTIDAAKPRGKDKNGVQLWGPAGGSIWASPTIDAKRKLVYVATGNGYADPPQEMNNAVVAMSIDSGKVRWFNQITPNDVWTLGCFQQTAKGNPACPAEMGPDFDFSASPALTTVNGRDLLVLPQKSGVAYALDPAKKGAIVWEYRIGDGSALGGQWGAAVDGENAYFGVADLQAKNPGGMRALRLKDGQVVWRVPPQPKLCKEGQRCLAGQGAALTAIPGAVLSSSLDGGLRAYSVEDGSVLWQFDTNRNFDTVNGVKANGGGMDGPGPIVVDGMLYVNSGYGGLVGAPGNVLLAFEVE